MPGSTKNRLFSALMVSAFLCACGGDDKNEGTDETDSGITGADEVDAGGTLPAAPLPDDVALPLLFVHGFAGSAQQYDSQATRFIANGYPPERIRAYEHDGAGFDFAGYVAGADEMVDGLRTDFGVEKVYLVGHSRGTLVSATYLGDATRAAKIAKYISLDGAGCAAADAAGVPCIAPSQQNLPGQAHVEVSTSAESFVEQYKFLIGTDPAVVEIVPQAGPVIISGRAVNFPANTGRDGTILNIFEVAGDTGARLTTEPKATFNIGPDGKWGPVTVSHTKHYEFELSNPAMGPTAQHFYGQRFLRSTEFVRLLSGPPDAPSRMNTNTGDNHVAITALRMREWQTTDTFEITATSTSGGDTAAVNAITAEVGNDNIALYVHDDKATPGESSLALLPWFPDQAFQTGVDVFIPAADPPDGTVSVTNLPRGDASQPQVINFPNWASTNHTIMLMFTDYPQH